MDGGSMPTALVTGGAGFVGRHLCRALLARGWDVTCVDPVVAGSGGLPPEAWPGHDPRDHENFSFLPSDCRDHFEKTQSGYDTVFHLAAIVGGRLMIERQPLLVADDLAIDAALWLWAGRVRPRKIVYFSSSAVYPVAYQGRDGHRLLSEDMVSFETTLGVPDMTYGWAKLTGEYTGRIAFERLGIESVAYRPFSGYGPDQDLNYPFPAIAKRLVMAEHGDDVAVWGSGRQMRDFIHIDDCIACVLGTMDKIRDGSALNISTGRLTSFIELAGMILKALGREARVQGESDKPEGVFARGGDTGKQRAFGFTPRIPLEDGIEDMVSHFRENRTAGAVAD
jgi:GDP-L-fucose synthase